MSEESAGTTRWRVLGTEADAPDEYGWISFHVTLENTVDGEIYVVTVSGLGTSPLQNFVQAPLAVAQTLANTVGANVPGARCIPAYPAANEDQFLLDDSSPPRGTKLN